MEKVEAKSVIFSWKPQDFDMLLKSCEIDDEVQLTLRYLPNKNAKILEAECGLGCIVKFLCKQGYKNVVGVEYDQAAVDFLRTHHVELNVVQGDVLVLPYRPHAPLKAMYDVLRPQGMAIVTVPSFNVIRRLLYTVHFFDVRKYSLMRRLFKKKPLTRNKKRYSYYIEPQYGPFLNFGLPHGNLKPCANKLDLKLLKVVRLHMLTDYFIFSAKNW